MMQCSTRCSTWDTASPDLALNLEETEVGVIILGDDTQLQEGDEVRTTDKLLQVPVGKALLGRVVNTLGEPLDGKGPIKK